ncbi:hypothetical protein ANCCEY_13548 [Ancylostoma ceylanicum]|uniref:HEAT repeat protein n=1 Tax=Ancylostoma ceylanicum TaxID=53326 RepID=A0A0D6LIB8_9BILA|nr:hypothetical protein ANCCEY_13548 [Ancylostoma ceylanicum]
MDLDEWLEVDDVDDEDEEESVAIGESALDRISCALNGKAILAPFLNLIDKMRHSDDWRERHVALMGFSVIGEGCQRSMEPHIQNYVREIIPFLNDKMLAAFDAAHTLLSGAFVHDLPKLIP